MGQRESYAPGTFCWAALATGDVGGAAAFYARVLGWDPGDDGVFRLGGAPVAGLRPPEDGGEAGWASYVAVADADAAAARVPELGGAVIGGPEAAGEAGRTAAVRDPAGAVVHLWQAGTRPGAARVNEPGAMVWNELASSEMSRAQAFYAALLGWTADADESGYATVRTGGALNGGIRPAQDGEPPGWLVYFTVASVDDATAAARAAGGRVLTDALDATSGRVAVVADPGGARLALFEGVVDP